MNHPVVLAASWDGKVLLCEGPVPARGYTKAHFTLDGETGAITRVFGADAAFVSGVGSVSADGRLVALARFDLNQGGTGSLIVFESAPAAPRQFNFAANTVGSRLAVAVAPDGRTAAGYVQGGDLTLFDLTKD